MGDSSSPKNRITNLKNWITDSHQLASQDKTLANPAISAIETVGKEPPLNGISIADSGRRLPEWIEPSH
jgi:hypothetical protein